jgi:hypothetical protein
MEAKKEELIEKLTNISHSPERAVFLNKDFSGLHLTNLKINGVLFRRCKFYATEFYNCSFQNCEFLDCDFGGTLLADVTFLNCNLVECDFKESRMQDVNFEGGFKSNNNFESLKIIKNVNGISPDESSVISDNIEEDITFIDKLNKLYGNLPFSTSDDYWKLTLNNVELIIGLETEPANQWRIMVGREIGPNIEDYESLQSVTVEPTIDLQTLHETVIDVIKNSLKNVDPEEIDTFKIINNLLHMFESINIINEDIDGPITQTWVALSDNDIDMLEQIHSALNHITNDMLDDMVIGEISNLLIKFEEFMNNKIRD